ncbi:MAG: DUF6600 domain-containing protein, partial [Thermoanaerobaculia bacterium]
MRKLAAVTFLAIAVSLPLYARGKNESYISYDDGGTVVRTGEDGKEIDARVNLPVFPGDEVITNRRGRAEVVLADGNVVGIDRATAVRFKSVLDSYDSESNDTIFELRYGKVAIYRSNDARESLRLDTQSASYFAGRQATFSVESDANGRDRLLVFDGSIEVRTPSRTSRVSAGESADVDDRGLYGLVSDDELPADDFERWFVKRTERYGNSNSRYLDRSLAYYDEDLGRHGNWTYIDGLGYGWRPTVSAGWRPYYYGQWASGPSGCLTWVSYEPWGWVPYHYGRWAYDSRYGWFWLPGASYAPAWVYWWYSPGYIGWAPAGWYDCYRPYYAWAYRPYARAGVDFGFGFYGRVRVNEIDLRPWTFINANTIISNRVDRAALSIDVVRGRLTRGPGGGLATVTGSPARFTRHELLDPGAAVAVIYRRGISEGSGSTGATGSVIPPTDMTPFFRRDADLAGSVRDRIIRTRPIESIVPARVSGGGGVAPAGSGGLAPIGRGSVAPIGSGSVAPIGSGSVAPTNSGDGHINRGDTGWRNNAGGGGSSGSGAQAPSRGGDTGGGRINRGGGDSRDNGGGRVNRGSGDTPRNNEETVNRNNGAAIEPSWRNRVNRVSPGGLESNDRPADRSTTGGRVKREEGGSKESAPAPSSGRTRSVDRGSSDVPRRVIDGIGGTRIYRGEGDRSSGRSSSGRDSAPPPQRVPEARPARESAPPRQAAPPPPRNEGQ